MPTPKTRWKEIALALLFLAVLFLSLRESENRIELGRLAREKAVEENRADKNMSDLADCRRQLRAYGQDSSRTEPDPDPESAREGGSPAPPPLTAAPGLSR